MTFTIEKEFSLSAAHKLNGLPDKHPCSRLHGHNYRVRVQLSSDSLDQVGFVRDYGELDVFKAYLERFDHHFLNDDYVFTANPTAENLAYHFYGWCRERFPEVVAVGVSETDKTWAWYDAREGVGVQR